MTRSWQETALAEVLDPGCEVTFLLDPHAGRDQAAGAPFERAYHHVLTERADPPSSDVLVLVARDPQSLRRCVTAIGESITASTVAVIIERSSASPPLLRPRPSWPRVIGFAARGGEGAFASATFDGAAPAAEVLSSYAQSLSPHRFSTTPWPTIGALNDEPHRWPVADRSAVVGHVGDVQAIDVDFPPSLVVSDAGHHERALEHPVVSGPLVWMAAGHELTWEEMDPATLPSLVAAGPLSLGGLDERLLNPRGFKRQFRQPVADLISHPNADWLTLRSVKGDQELSAHHGPSDQDIAPMRRLAGVRLGWEGCRGPHAYARVVAGLAMAGVPLVTDRVPRWAQALLHEDVVAALETPVNLDDMMEREVHSIRLRRAAINHHSASGWRADAAEHYGLQESPSPRVSVLLPTKRPDQLRFALNQVARQQGVQTELILATHGFAPDPSVISEVRGRSGVHIENFEAPESMAFGEMLNGAAQRASGDVLLKMDDDDWYGRDFVSDLLLTRSYSGADVVGTPPEFTFVDPLWVTVRRQDATEAFRPIVAGGTIMVGRELFRELGGFRHTHKYVDAAFLAAVRQAGGNVYRGHGHGYVLRRGSGGHTWDPGLRYFVGRRLSWQQRRGFAPSPLLQPDAAELPVRTQPDSTRTAEDT